jgi:hypothetical protein
MTLIKSEQCYGAFSSWKDKSRKTKRYANEVALYRGVLFVDMPLRTKSMNVNEHVAK